MGKLTKGKLDIPKFFFIQTKEYFETKSILLIVCPTEKIFNEAPLFTNHLTLTSYLGLNKSADETYSKYGFIFFLKSSLNSLI